MAIEYLGPKYLDFNLRLVLSADIVGSTQFKQGLEDSASEDNRKQSAPVGPPWYPAFEFFYSKFPITFLKKWNKSVDADKYKTLSRWAGEAPQFWKAVGDELLFVKEVSDPRQVLLCLHAWRCAINSFRLNFQEKSSNLNKEYRDGKSEPILDLKSTAWVANFPIANVEVIIPDNLKNGDKPEGQRYFELLKSYYGLLPVPMTPS